MEEPVSTGRMDRGAVREPPRAVASSNFTILPLMSEELRFALNFFGLIQLEILSSVIVCILSWKSTVKERFEVQAEARMILDFRRSSFRGLRIERMGAVASKVWL
ncbi:hypothetical protein R1flu_003113 [Riccia fluitans]|uniref:Uncharacterized protein n=1 Tax=Riccia fluitans TaxID=41844 RepID=A0ABD1Y886_9MARC